VPVPGRGGRAAVLRPGRGREGAVIEGEARAGLTFIWQLLHRPVLPFITSGFVEVKLMWKLACAHSLPCTPATVETPCCEWQKLQSWLETLISVCVI